jgi:hypothetical protein
MNRFLVLLALAACGPATPARSPAQRAEASAAAVAALQASKFDDAIQQATAVLAADPGNSRAAAVRATASYVTSIHALIERLGQIIAASERLEFFENPIARAAWQTFLTKLEAIDRDLAIAAAARDFSLELSLARWAFDWNHNGAVDDRDRQLFELEFDGHGGELAATDPRRRPTFRFDTGDADWARAMIAFQRATGELVLAYKWSELTLLFASFGGEQPITIRMIDKPRVARARTLILDGLGFADRSRAAYLAETDDDREWVPNPHQRNHPMPLEIDDTVYSTWAGVIGDVRNLLDSKDGIALHELASTVDDDPGDKLTQRLPDAFIDLGRMLSDPKDIVVDLHKLDHDMDAASVEAVLRSLIGNGYQTKMEPSPLVSRLRAMKIQLDRGEDTFERKLRYLLWLN